MKQTNPKIYFVLDEGIRQHTTPITYKAAIGLAKEIKGWGGKATIATIYEIEAKDNN